MTSDLELKKSSDSTEYTISRARSVTVEPGGLFFTFGLATYAFSTQLYVYERIAQDHGMSWFNLSHYSHQHCSLNSSDPLTIVHSQVEAKAAEFLNWMYLARKVPVIFLIVYYLSLSDARGRRFVMILPAVWFNVVCATFLVVVYFELPLEILIAVSAVYGLFGGMELFLMALFAYIGDVTCVQRRSFRMTVMQTFLFLGTIPPPVLMGIWAQNHGFVGCSVVALLCGVVTLIYMYFCVPESLHVSRPAPLISFEYFSRPLRLYGCGWGGGRLLLPLLIIILAEVHQSEETGPDTMFALGPPLCWSPAQLGVYNAVSQAVLCLLPAPCVALLSACRFSDRAILIMAVLNSLFVYLLRALSFNSVTFYTAACIGVMTQVIAPVTRSMTSQTVSPTSYGAVFAVSSALSSASMLVGLTLFSQVLASTVRGYTGAFYAVGAGIDVICLSIAVIYVRRFKRYGYDSMNPNNTCNSASDSLTELTSEHYYVHQL